MKSNKIKLFVSDVDGTLTDGCTYYSARGEEMKKFNMRDGMGIELLKNQHIIPVIVTKENSRIVQQRAEKLKIDVYCGVKDKLEALKIICEQHGINLEEVAYIGDDINDLEAMKAIGLSFAPSDAVSQVKKVASVVMKRKGGEGAVREAIDHILEINKR